MPVPSLATDLYQLTMMAGYFRTGRHRLRATFELFTRRLPPNRACLVFAGLEQAIDYLEHLRFTPAELDWLAAQPCSRPSSRSSSGISRPSGLPVTSGPWTRARLSSRTSQSFASRRRSRGTARRDGSPGDRQLSNHDCQQGRAYRSRGGRRPVLEFGARRAHGLEAALYAARAAHLAGCTSTSFVDAGRQFGIPLPERWRIPGSSRQRMSARPSSTSQVCLETAASCCWIRSTSRRLSRPSSFGSAPGGGQAG